jgi:calcium permeable stress-gated cation channel
MDAYFFVRFLRLMCKLFLPIWLISWAVLMPDTSVNTLVSGHSGLDIFVFGNVEKSKTDRYAAHIILVWIFTGEFVVVFTKNMWLIWPKFGFGTTSNRK